MNNVCKTVNSGLLVGLVLFLLLPLVTSVPVRASTELTMNSFDSQGNMSINGRTQSTEGGSVVPSKTKITDPTGKTEGYFLEDYSDDSFELIASRGQTSRHFYDKMTGLYTFQSDHLVFKEGVIDGTNWVTKEEYPHRFILRLQNGDIHFFDSAYEISAFLDGIDRSTLWAVGFESFDGVMGFYLNFQDIVHGHGQYLYWPRLNNGSITPYNLPLYAFYPHLFVKYNGVLFDQILNDRSLYLGENQNPRNTLEFYNTDTEFGIFFSLEEVNIQRTVWNFVHGFKYCKDDQLYHMITELQSVNHDFEDIGLAYEITSSPQSDNTPYQPVAFQLCNENFGVTLPIQEAWEAGQYLENFYSRLNIISENNETFCFSFEDMEQTGFTKKYLDLHDQRMPDGSVRKVLRAGMYGLGEYCMGKMIKIDPSIDTKYSTDNYDLWYGPMWGWQTAHTIMKCGMIPGPYPYSYSYATSYVAFDTEITQIISDTLSVSLQLYVTSSTMDDSNEGAKVKVYNIGGNANYNTAKENSKSYSLGTNKQTTNFVYSGSLSSGYKTADATEMESLTDYWAMKRNNDENWISFQFLCFGQENGDYYFFRDSQYSETGQEPKLTFQYGNYLETDWARHPTNQAIINKVNALIAGASTDYGKAERIQWKTEDDWNQEGGIPYGYFEQDTTIYDAYIEDNEVYNRKCYGASVIASSYARAANIPSRIIFYKCVKPYGNHYTAEVWINNQWVPIDVSDWYGWFGTNSTAIAQIHEHFPEEPLTKEHEIEDLFVIIRFQSSTNYLMYDMKTFDPDQYNWYKTNVWPYLT